jgi:enoyl-[acyl-carrier protein] reductase I
MEALDLNGRKGLVVGVANEHSLAWWAAEHFHNAGAELAVTYLNDKAKPFVEPLAKRVEAPIFLPCNVSIVGELEAVFEVMQKRWGRLDFLFHSIAWARKEDLHGRLTDCSADGFAESMLVSCHSLIRMAKLAELLMDKGGGIMSLSYYGAEKVVDHYNVMGPVKAALEAPVRYLAHELGHKGIRSTPFRPVPSRRGPPRVSSTSMSYSARRCGRYPCGEQLMPARSGVPRCCWRATTPQRSPARSSMSMLVSTSRAWCSIDSGTDGRLEPRRKAKLDEQTYPRTSAK